MVRSLIERLTIQPDGQPRAGVVGRAVRRVFRVPTEPPTVPLAVPPLDVPVQVTALEPTKEDLMRVTMALRNGLIRSTYINLDALDISLREMYERQVVIESPSHLVLQPNSVAPNNQSRPLNYRAEEGGEFVSITAFRPSAEDKQKAGIRANSLEVAGLRVIERTSKGELTYNLYFDITRAWVVDTSGVSTQEELAKVSYTPRELISYGGYGSGGRVIR